MKRTKIVATIGPSSSDRETLRRLIESGMDVVRLNFSHGTHESHGQIIDTVRLLEKEYDKPVAILQDLSGPKIRLGNFTGEVYVKKNEILTLVQGEADTTKRKIPLRFTELHEYVEPGQNILIDDGKIKGVIRRIKNGEITVAVLNDGVITSGKGINLPDGGAHGIPALTEKDKKDLQYGLEKGVDWIALSFVKTAEDVRELKTIISYLGYDTPVIAKIEKPEALDDLDRIVMAVDGIMVARGDLGVEIALERVTLEQKRIIHQCNAQAKPVIVATQMLESMVENPQPTRAEVADVTNAILDGADAVMLSQETTIGKYPVASVDMMSKICCSTEHSLDYIEILEKEINYSDSDPTNAIAFSAVQIAQKLQVKAIVCFTMHGDTSRILTRYKPCAPILALTPYAKTCRRLALSWATWPVKVKRFNSTPELLKVADKICIQEKLAGPGDLIIITAGLPFQKSGATNFIKVKRIDQGPGNEK